MATLVLIARNIGRPYAVLRALCITGVVMIALNPYLLGFDPGFQLSFLATLGLILVAPELEKRFTLIPKIAGLRGYLSTTIGTQLYVLPVLLFSMGTLSLVSICVNVLVLPVVPLAMLLTFAVGVVGTISASVALVFGFGAHLVLTYIIKVAEFAAAIPFAAVTLPAFPFWIVVLLYVGLGVLTFLLSRSQFSNEKTTAVINVYEGWVIEEVKKDTLLETQSVPRSVSDPLPFR